ncbi:MAG: transposase, partial [Firmicutes bacterium]|nr:transposase [Bacillota bacterium]
MSHATFVGILKYIALLKGKEVIFIGRFYPSFKTCHACGDINHKLSLSDRSWTCVCGVTHDRDRNAAINILLEGASSIGPG